MENLIPSWMKHMPKPEPKPVFDPNPLPHETFSAWASRNLDHLRETQDGREFLDVVFEKAGVPRKGVWVEFGVSSGHSLRKLAKERGEAIVYGFDSFEGNPEPWQRRPNGTYRFPMGAFKADPPEVPGVTIVKGMFEETLKDFLPEVEVTFAHIDSDLYASAACALDWLKTRLVPGAVVVFDEIVGYHGFEEEEMRALEEAAKTGGFPPFDWILAHSDKGALRIR